MAAASASARSGARVTQALSDPSTRSIAARAASASSTGVTRPSRTAAACSRAEGGVATLTRGILPGRRPPPTPGLAQSAARGTSSSTSGAARSVEADADRQSADGSRVVTVAGEDSDTVPAGTLAAMRRATGSDDPR
jgi:hypothetical protein